MALEFQSPLQCLSADFRAMRLQGGDRSFFIWSKNRDYAAFANSAGLLSVSQAHGEGTPQTGWLKQMSNDYPYSSTFNILGGVTWVRCKYRDCLEDIRSHFSCSESRETVTPDVVVYCDSPRASRYLFRARPTPISGPLEDVKLMTAGTGNALRAWRSHYPVLPPLAIEPFANRFVGIHASAVIQPNGEAILFAGERGAGKSTVAVDWVNHGDCSLLTDETVFLHRRTAIVEPFPIAIGLKQGAAQQGKELIPACRAVRRVAAEPAVVKAVVLLFPDSSQTSYSLQQLGDGEGLRGLLRHHLDVGADLDESMITLAFLAAGTPMWSFRYNGYANLFALKDVFSHLNDRVQRLSVAL